MSTSKKLRTDESLKGFGKSVEPLTEAQADYINAIKEDAVIFGLGSAGTGKTYIPAMYAAEQLYYKRVGKVIITRPNVEASATLGLLPGELHEKYAPYLEPFENVFKRALGNQYEADLKAGKIAPKPLGYMRGMTFDNAIVLVDECQNMTEKEFKLILSRIGRDCKMIFSGDDRQIDVKNSGLQAVQKILSRMDDISFIRFNHDDIVRSDLCKRIIIAFEQ
jgi:phosphate starvation-inducible protein PhoH and related proteins